MPQQTGLTIYNNQRQSTNQQQQKQRRIQHHNVTPLQQNYNRKQK